MTVLLPALVPVISIVLIGFFASRTLALEGQTLSQLTIYVFAPALIAGSLYRTTLSAQSALRLVAGFAIASLLLYLVVRISGKLFQLPDPIQKSLIATTLFANNGNLGLPLVAFTFGEQGLERAVVYLVASAVLMVGAGPTLLKGEGIKAGIELTLKLPLVWAMVGGLLLRVLDIQLPSTLDEGITMLGNAAIPVALILLGMQLASTRIVVRRFELFAASLRLLLAPAIAYTVGYCLKLEGLDLQVLIMQGAMPTAVNALVWVTEFGGDAPCVARTIVLSTLMSFLTLPLVLWASSP